jgi:cytochrome d ubiquinol oxidase subunit I
MVSPTLLDVSRWQFALTAAFHMTFPAITVGLSIFLTVVYGIYWRTGNRTYLQIFRFWKKIFAVGFGLGVVAGTVLTFEFGLNWGGYARAAGPILGVIIGMEVVTAFFLEAGFIGLLLYGDGRISPRVMFFSSCMVSLGTVLSTTWIMSANSWMQTPAGYEVVDGQFVPVDWLAALLNPSFVHRWPHMLLGVLIGAGWLVAGIGAYYLLRGEHRRFARTTFSIAMAVLAVVVPIQMYLGDGLAFFMGGVQPAKLQAIEGNWVATNTGYNLIVVPDPARERNLVQVTVPLLDSWIAKDFSGRTPAPGLLQTPDPADRPNVWPVFYGFRAMFFGALAMYAVLMTGVVQRLRGRFYTASWLHRAVLWMTPVGVVAVIGGWVTSEAGRQPFVAYGLLRTSDAVSALAPGTVIASFVGFVGLYVALFGIWAGYVVRTVRRGPDDADLLEPAPPEPVPTPVAAQA